MEKICEFCGTRFHTHIVVKKFCRRNCRDQAERLQEHYHQLTAACSPLRVIKGDLAKTIRKAERASNLVDFCQVNLWPDKYISLSEKLKLSDLAGTFFKGSLDINQTFRLLIEATALFKQDIQKKNMQLMPDPQDWLDNRYRYGLSESIKAIETVQHQRQSIAGYRMGLSILSEAVLKYFETKNVLDVPLYRNRLAIAGETGLMQMYFNTVIQVQFLTM